MRAIPTNILYIIFCTIFFAFGLYIDQIGYKQFSVLFLTATLLGIVAMPTKYSVYGIMIFIWFQGFFKIVSNYHPLIHVGADIVILCLLAKMLIFRQEYRKFPPFTLLFIIHFIWLFVELFNPYSLGITASIAGSKVYITMFLLYFFGYFTIRNTAEVHKIFFLFVILALIQVVFSIYQGYNGANSVLSIHPGYQIQLNKFKGYAFRPFGLTHVPGGPSVYIYMVIPFVLYFLISSKRTFDKLLYFSLLPAIGLTLIFCQVRSAIVKSIFAFFIFSLLSFASKANIFGKNKIRYFITTLIITVSTLFSLNYLIDITEKESDDTEQAVERSLSVFDIQSMEKARRGAWDRFILYAQQVPLGAGFSRVGAAAGAFEVLNANDPHFPRGHFFSDNLFVHLLIEVGLPGLILITFLALSILYFGVKFWRNEKDIHLIGPVIAILSSLCAIFIGSYGGEGLVYNPESGFFWLFSGVLVSIGSEDFIV